jgi:serine/threonine-protein kinase
MAPEILLEQMPDTRSDIFSFGIVFYELWSGRHPFRSHTAIQTANRIMNEQPSPLRSFVPGTPESLDQIIARCLTKNPGDRYQDAIALLSDLKKVEAARASSI